MAADEVFVALSDPTRRQIMSLVGERREVSASALAQELPVSRQAISKHLESLAGAGLVSTRRDGREVLYRLTPQPLSEAMSWMVNVGGEWDQRLADLRKLLARRQVRG
jgi:DNA-binding transcriptional ArsR family regulator